MIREPEGTGVPQHDSVLFEISCFFPLGVDVPESLPMFLSTRTDPEHGTVVTFGEYTISEDSWQVRQAKFEDAVKASSEKVRTVGISRQLRDAGVICRVRIAVVPEEGDAGVQITAETLATWADFGAEIMISGWPGQTWFDARYRG